MPMTLHRKTVGLSPPSEVKKQTLEQKAPYSNLRVFNLLKSKQTYDTEKI